MLSEHALDSAVTHLKELASSYAAKLRQSKLALYNNV